LWQVDLVSRLPGFEDGLAEYERIVDQEFGTPRIARWDADDCRATLEEGDSVPDEESDQDPDYKRGC